MRKKNGKGQDGKGGEKDEVTASTGLVLVNLTTTPTVPCKRPGARDDQETARAGAGGGATSAKGHVSPTATTGGYCCSYEDRGQAPCVIPGPASGGLQGQDSDGPVG